MTREDYNPSFYQRPKKQLAEKRCNTRRSTRNNSPLCILERDHKGDHWGYIPNTNRGKWWERKSE